jgi:hypothetical protein
MANLTAYVPKPRFIVGTAISLAVIVLLLRAAGANPTVQKVRSYLGLSV